MDESNSPTLVRFGLGARVLPVDRETQQLQKEQEELQGRHQKQEQEVVRCHEEARSYLAQGNKAQVSPGHLFYFNCNKKVCYFHSVESFILCKFAF